MGTDGLPVLLRGIIWSGFQNGAMVEGLQVAVSTLPGIPHHVFSQSFPYTHDVSLYPAPYIVQRSGPEVSQMGRHYHIEALHTDSSMGHFPAEL